jgi:hypothetical protein
LKIVFKRNGLSGVDSLMQVGVATSAAPTTFSYYPAGTCRINGWNETTINLSALSGSNVAALALKFASETTVNSYEIRIGKIVIYNSGGAAPKPPENIQELNVVSWNGSVSGRVKWDHVAGDHYAYLIYVRLLDGSLVFVGSTPSNYFYFENIAISGDFDSIVVQTVAPDMTASRYSDDAAPSITVTPLTAGAIRLSWPTIAGSVLESSTTLLAPDWQAVTGVTIVELNGTSYLDLSTSSPTRRFFRLRW